MKQETNNKINDSEARSDVKGSTIKDTPATSDNAFTGVKVSRRRARFSPSDIAQIGVGAATVAVATMFIRYPTPGTGGHINFGDIAVIFFAFNLGRRNAFLAGGIGSAIADFMGGYGFFVPITFAAKGLEGYAAAIIGFEKSLGYRIAGGLCGAAVMVTLYTLWHITVTGYAPAMASIPGNIIQGITGVTGAVLLDLAFKRRKMNTRK